MQSSHPKSSPQPYKTLQIEQHPHSCLAILHRPEALNALNQLLMQELYQLVEEVEQDPSIACLVLTGSETVFAAGADIKEMQNRDFSEVFIENYMGTLDRISQMRKPVIAAVAGHALGGGCELAMMCDLLIAAENAKFGQPEIGLGIIPGAGGTQRLLRAIGKAKAMDLCLTGRKLSAQEAEQAGLVSRIVPTESLKEEALRAAAQIAKMPRIATLMLKETLNRGQETSLSEGLLFERRAFHALFGTEDQKEGMAAFLEKRPPVFATPSPSAKLHGSKTSTG